MCMERNVKCHLSVCVCRVGASDRPTKSFCSEAGFGHAEACEVLSGPLMGFGPEGYCTGEIT